MFVCLFMCVFVSVHVCRGQRTVGVLPQELSTVFFKQGLSLACGLLIRTGRGPVRRDRRTSFFHVLRELAWFIARVQGIELGSSLAWTVSPAWYHLPTLFCPF